MASEAAGGDGGLLTLKAETGDRFKGDYQIVAFDLDTTGRRLVDEICQVAGHYYAVRDGQPHSFSQYVMPHKYPSRAARMSSGITVISNSWYRTLKNIYTGDILQTKSEVSALQAFLRWLKEAKATGVDGIILLYHEPNIKVVVPFLLQALHRHNLMEEFKQVVVGFVNGVSVAGSLGGKKSIITSNSLRSLCKTVLLDTNPATTSASDRAKLLMQIMTKLTLTDPDQEPTSVSSSANPEDENGRSQRSSSGHQFSTLSMTRVAATVCEEEEDLRKLKDILSIESTLWAVFSDELKVSKPSRRRAMALRRRLAESRLDYQALLDIFEQAGAVKQAGEPSEEKSDAFLEAVKGKIRDRMRQEILEEDLDELVNMFKTHLEQSDKGKGAESPVSRQNGKQTDGAAAKRNGGRSRQANKKGQNQSSGQQLPNSKKAPARQKQQKESTCQSTTPSTFASPGGEPQPTLLKENDE